MPNLKHAKKALRNQNRKAGVNKAWKVRVKKISDELNSAVKANSKDIQDMYTKYQKVVDKALKNNIFHVNKANRLKSSVYKKINSLGKD